MSTTQHTPGPWSRNIRAGGKYPTVFAGRNTHVAVVQQRPTPEETEANIDLIAAAPDLLALARDLTAALAAYVADHKVSKRGPISGHDANALLTRARALGVAP